MLFAGEIGALVVARFLSGRCCSGAIPDSGIRNPPLSDGGHLFVHEVAVTQGGMDNAYNGNNNQNRTVPEQTVLDL
jgi:hypothetical protein